MENTPNELDAAKSEVDRWLLVLQRLDSIGTHLAEELADRKKERFAALAAQDEPLVKRLTKAVTGIRHELQSLPELRDETMVQLVQARQKVRALAIADMVGLLLMFDQQVAAAQQRALETKLDQDIDNLLDAARMQHSLSVELVSLTANDQYRRPWDVDSLGGDSMHIRQQLKLRQLPGNRRGPSRTPW